MGYVSKIWVLGMPCMGADRQLKCCLIMMGHYMNSILLIMMWFDVVWFEIPLEWAVGSVPKILFLVMVGHISKFSSSSYNSWNTRLMV